MDYNFSDIESKWQAFWADHKTFQPGIEAKKPKYYVLDMFPYPSGAGLHVGHPLGYIASDIIARYKRLKGFNVLHPMGYDSFGLPAEQYAIQTGQHPAITTQENINRYRIQMDKMGFSFDWSREVRTSNPEYYRWTQWIFGLLFNSWYPKKTNKAEPLESLIEIFQESGNIGLEAHSDSSAEVLSAFTAKQWNDFSEREKQAVLMNYRMAYLADSYVNWCLGLGTVLANEEVKDGFSERGGFPVERKKMKQWVLRITAYADRLLEDLQGIDWSDSLKEMQRNWIGLSKGCSIQFKVNPPSENGIESNEIIEVFTTRPDTIFGCTFLVLAPENELVEKITTKDKAFEVEDYIHSVSNRSERDRMAEVKKVTGRDTGAKAIHPFTGELIPIWIADYVLAGYGTGAVMAVPGGDERDFRFAKEFDLPIIQVVEGYTHNECYAGKEGIMMNSPSKEILDKISEKEKDSAHQDPIIKSDLNGLNIPEATVKIIEAIEHHKIGKGKKEYRMRDAGFSRQRYWGEPIPIYYKDDIPYLLSEEELPLRLPEVDEYLPTESGEPPLARAKNWSNKDGYPLETNTMPGWAGSSWYYLRYQDPNNTKVFASKDALTYWNQIDLYIGGSEHATGHLLYVRFWTKFLYDLGFIPFYEPAKKLVNQGMILGRSNFVYRITGSKVYLSYSIYQEILKEDKLFEGNIEELNILNILLEPEKYRDLLKKHICKIIKILILENMILGSAKESVQESVQGSVQYVALVKIGDLLEANLERIFSKNEFSDFLKEIEIASFNFSNDQKRIIQAYATAIINSNKKGAIHDFPFPIQMIHVDVNLVQNDILNTKKFVEFKKEDEKPYFILSEDNQYHCGHEVEKMSKSKFNVVTPDQIIEEYGADTLRMYEMFLGPLELAKPWNTNGIEGVYRFLKKFWRLFHDENHRFKVDNGSAGPVALKILHKTIKKIEDDLENLSFNTSISQFMICVNELSSINCNNRAILEPLTILLSPFAPHICEEIWELLGHPSGNLSFAPFPKFNPEYLIESEFNYPISINGKFKLNYTFPLDLDNESIQNQVLTLPEFQKYIQGQIPKKIIVVKGKIINVVI